MATGTIQPRRLALRYAPPGIIVEYAAAQSSVSASSPSRRSQLFHHEIDLQDVLRSQGGPRSNDRLEVDTIVAKLIAAHGRVLGDQKMSACQLARLVQKLIDQTSVQDEEVGQEEPERAAPMTTTAATAAVLPQADYNRVSETQLKQVKMKMDLVFQQNLVRPGEDGYQYDKEVAFTPTQEASDWDDE